MVGLFFPYFIIIVILYVFCSIQNFFSIFMTALFKQTTGVDPRVVLGESLQRSAASSTEKGAASLKNENDGYLIPVAIH